MEKGNQECSKITKKEANTKKPRKEGGSNEKGGTGGAVTIA